MLHIECPLKLYKTCPVAKDFKLQCIERQPIDTPQHVEQSQNTCECSVLYMMLMQPVQITLCLHVNKGKIYVARPDCKFG